MFLGSVKTPSAGRSVMASVGVLLLSMGGWCWLGGWLCVLGCVSGGSVVVVVECVVFQHGEDDVCSSASQAHDGCIVTFPCIAFCLVV